MDIVAPPRRRGRPKLVLAAVWAVAIGGYVWFMRSRGLSPIEAAEELRSALADNWWGPALFVAVYTLRSLVLFPASVLSVLGGLAFGPIWATVLTVLASNLSTSVAYAVGRFFGDGPTAERLVGALGGLIDRARRNPFETTLVMRLLYLPYDAVAYVAGFFQLRFAPFIAGSALGTLPGTMSFVGFGASITSLDEGTPEFDLRILGASLALAVAGFLFSQWLRRRQDVADTPETVEVHS